MLTKEQVETLIKETQIKEKMNSPRQVLEKYPELNAMYEMACVVGENSIFETSDTDEQSAVENK